VPTRSAVPTILHQRCFTIVPPVRATFRSSIHCTRKGNLSETKQAVYDTDSSKSAIPACSALLNASNQRIVTKRMATYKKSGTPSHSSSSRRIIVVVVPPVDELDLVGPLQVFNSVNRLADRKIYAIEVVTNAERLIVEGEGGVLTFMAKDHFNKVEGACDSCSSFADWALDRYATRRFLPG